MLWRCTERHDGRARGQSYRSRLHVFHCDLCCEQKTIALSDGRGYGDPQDRLVWSRHGTSWKWCSCERGKAGEPKYPHSVIARCIFCFSTKEPQYSNSTYDKICEACHEALDETAINWFEWEERGEWPHENLEYCELCGALVGPEGTARYGQLKVSDYVCLCNECWGPFLLFKECERGLRLLNKERLEKFRVRDL